MKKVKVNGKDIQPDPNASLGKGGEGEVFDIGKGLALKLFFPPNHQLYAGKDEQQKRNREGARQRLKLMQSKLLEFPKLPDTVVQPIDLAYDSSGQVIGYTMRYLQGAEVLRSYTKSGFRTSGGIDNNAILELFRSKHETLRGVHAAGAQIGDYNYLGSMVAGKKVYLIDADSIQFGKYRCNSFTPRFVDPLLCAADALLPVKPHTEESDWYAFSLMLFECLLLVAPYGGVHKPLNKQGVRGDRRMLQRIWVGHDDVKYPDKAVPLRCLTDELLELFLKLLTKDWRGEFPLELLEHTHWSTCPSCGVQHAHAACPVCRALAPAAPSFREEKHGKVLLTREFHTAGVILRAVWDGSRLCYLYHENGEFKREGGRVLGQGTLQPRLRSRIQGQTTLFGLRDNLFVAESADSQDLVQVDTYQGRFPVFDTSDRHRYWIDGGRLVRDDGVAPKFIGRVSRNQTLFWCGNRFGFGFYQAGEIRRAFVFDTRNDAFDDSVEMPDFSGSLIDAQCFFSSQRCWLHLVCDENGRIVYHCISISPDGRIMAQARAEEGDGSWIENLRGKCAVTVPGKSGGPVRHCLFAATDEGLVRIEEEHGRLVERACFTDTKGLITEDHRLVPAKQGIYVISDHDVRLMKLGG